MSIKKILPFIERSFIVCSFFIIACPFVQGMDMDDEKSYYYDHDDSDAETVVLSDLEINDDSDDAEIIPTYGLSEETRKKLAIDLYTALDGAFPSNKLSDLMMDDISCLIDMNIDLSGHKYFDNKNIRTAFSLVSGMSDTLPLLKKFYYAGVDIDEVSPCGITPVWSAIISGDFINLLYLVLKGAKITKYWLGPPIEYLEKKLKNIKKNTPDYETDEAYKDYNAKLTIIKSIQKKKEPIDAEVVRDYNSGV